ncbi:MAG: acyl-CoA dehydrogenase family protein, partial [Patescibacteria group bacterium]
MVDATKPLRGCAFLVENEIPDQCFTPEDVTAEQRQMRQAVADYVVKEVMPKIDRLEKQDFPLMVSILKQAGALGFLGLEVPEAYGGMGLSMIDSALVFEGFGAGGSASLLVTIGAHGGIGTVPLLFFGNDEQRGRYLAKLATAELIGAYALTEPESGSDALAAKTKAELTPDGKHYKVNGKKRFITNAGFADLFTVLAKVDGQNACLLIERATPGVSIGKEEHKMGLKGSSTCEVMFDDALVPVENLLGQVGSGQKVIFNTLNYGRFKLGAGAAGALKAGIAQVLAYATARKQFGKSLTEFDAIRAKFADMVVAAWVGESMVYRTAGLLAKNLHGVPFGNAAAKAIHEYTAECAMVKVVLSEMVDNVVDDAVQIYGGYGYIEDYPAARAYRDARVQRIFEGTNEINRMLVLSEFAKRQIKGEVDFLGPYQNLERVPAFDARNPQTALPVLKTATLAILGFASEKLMMRLEDEQQILLKLADMLMAVFAAESALLRLEKMRQTGNADAALAEAVVKVCLRQAAMVVRDGLESVMAFAEEEKWDASRTLNDLAEEAL